MMGNPIAGLMMMSISPFFYFAGEWALEKTGSVEPAIPFWIFCLMTLFGGLYVAFFEGDYPGEKLLAEGDLIVTVEWFEDSSTDDKIYQADALTRRNSNKWYKLYKDGERFAELNNSHIKKISWEGKESGESGYHKTTNRGADVIINGDNL